MDSHLRGAGRRDRRHPDDQAGLRAAAPQGEVRPADHVHQSLHGNGLGGGLIYEFVYPLPESQFRYKGGYGAMLVSAAEMEMNFAFYNRSGKLIDSYQVTKP